METINRISFIKNIAISDDIKEIICNYFDQNMVLYNLINQNINGINITYSVDNNIIIFTIKSNEKDIVKINSSLNNIDIIYCYGKVYNIKSYIENTDLKIKFTDITHK